MTSSRIIEDWFGKYGEGSTSEPVRRFTLSNRNNMSVEVITYGATITAIKVPDKNGKIEDVVLGFDKIQDYYNCQYYFGCTVGRVTNRIANGKFAINGSKYTLAVNNGPNHLHGGLKGFDKALWSSHVVGDTVTMSYTSRDGEEGYPGLVQASVTFQLSDNNELNIDYRATSTKPTPINLTNHSYFNLAGQGRDVYDHLVSMNADTFTPVDDTSIPTGEVQSVRGSPFDLTSSINLGERLKVLDPLPGFDHNFCVNGASGAEKRLVARVEHPGSGRVLEVLSTKPGVQFYTGNFLPTDDSCKGKQGNIYQKHGAFCLETQYYPDSINHSNFPSCLFGPGQVYQHSTVFKFSLA